ncbi:TPA: hypothetical protein KAL00_003163 [Escherichia coli]|uniref:Uncharacterized protein n=1 Tax=Salmonella enterica subsp. enterica serovar Typhi str. CT18 TaxID=220341 RepID=A0A715RAZ8_SALTI|nr:hypothetical protein [Salmonella enterica subsp. enterica serovar 4,[5],12:i:-]EFV2950207.1 hypothetical protein [Salmonella enterica subsp. enterica serovar 4,[5],12:i:-]HAD4886428.1 hypothetical protein [Salmonella enterica subsp. enterica serovar Typhi str. CT18]HBB3875668.1 hypothetical protein [Escherichia coli]
MSCLQAEAISPLANDHGACWSGTVGFNPLNRQTMEASWSGTVAFNPLNRQAMEECWSRTMAFNPLNRQAMG